MYEVVIEAEACVLQCEVTDLVIEQPQPGVWSSDWDAEGCSELEFRVVSGTVYDEQGRAEDLGRNGCAALAERYAEYIEEQILQQYQEMRTEVPL
ncbi:hypothetical protein AYO08_10705 [Pseudomonas putida]|uniref:hypothetical protein n=1 Tax=Pseudomonas putida TaxID=303 RepID=UPI0007DFA9EC|nr:hypothetical protein [Pseudomonas putida]OAS07786.1 hypothetical protein AYO08_10705 [Pseudomonas putida]QNV69387.1 hypothetical protein F7661_28115 [Pseudomonas sp. CFA]